MSKHPRLLYTLYLLLLLRFGLFWLLFLLWIPIWWSPLKSYTTSYWISLKSTIFCCDFHQVIRIVSWFLICLSLIIVVVVVVIWTSLWLYTRDKYKSSETKVHSFLYIDYTYATTVWSDYWGVAARVPVVWQESNRFLSCSWANCECRILPPDHLWSQQLYQQSGLWTSGEQLLWWFGLLLPEKQHNVISCASAISLAFNQEIKNFSGLTWIIYMHKHLSKWYVVFWEYFYLSYVI